MDAGQQQPHQAGDRREPDVATLQDAGQRRAAWSLQLEIECQGLKVADRPAKAARMG
jgi:hypothetical protein